MKYPLRYAVPLGPFGAPSFLTTENAEKVFMRDGLQDQRDQYADLLDAWIAERIHQPRRYRPDRIEDMITMLQQALQTLDMNILSLDVPNGKQIDPCVFPIWAPGGSLGDTEWANYEAIRAEAIPLYARERVLEAQPRTTATQAELDRLTNQIYAINVRADAAWMQWAHVTGKTPAEPFWTTGTVLLTVGGVSALGAGLYYLTRKK